jgi:hypothetical protein
MPVVVVPWAGYAKLAPGQFPPKTHPEIHLKIKTLFFPSHPHQLDPLAAFPVLSPASPRTQGPNAHTRFSSPPFAWEKRKEQNNNKENDVGNTTNSSSSTILPKESSRDFQYI